MKRTIKNITSLLIVLAISVAFVFTCSSCKNNGKTATISFETNGAQAIESQKIKIGEEYTLPEPASRTGFDFLGWFETNEFDGEAITSIKVESDKTFYAKWDKLYKITLDANGGTCSTDTVYLKKDAKILEALSEIIPEKDHYKFAVWTNDGREVNAIDKISSDMTLVAKYKIEYTINVYEESLENVKEYGNTPTETITLYDFVGKNVTYDAIKAGFAIDSERTTATSISLLDNYSANVLNVYCERQIFTINFRTNYPNSTENDNFTYTLRYGETLDVPDLSLSYKGFMHEGWSRITSGESTYKANLSSLDVYNTEIDEEPESISTDRNITLFAIWRKGYTDMFGGGDYVFLLERGELEIYLNRNGIIFKGDYSEADDMFYFENGKGGIFTGILFKDGTFAYQDGDRASLTYTLNVTGKGFDFSQRIQLDAYNGITYYKTVNNTPSASKGTYKINEKGQYVVTYTEGSLKGVRHTYILGTAYDEESKKELSAFMIRNEEDATLGGNGTVLFAYIANNAIQYEESVNSLTFSGFGTASFFTGSEYETYYYTRIERNLYALVDDSNEEIGTIKIIAVNGRKCYLFYEESLDNIYINEDGSTLTTDGVSEATYVGADGKTIQGLYTYTESVFGGLILNVYSNGDEYKFMCNESIYEDTESGIEYLIHEFEMLDIEYDEYIFKGQTYFLYAPLIVKNTGIKENGYGTASLYGFDVTTRTYVLASKGTYKVEDGKTIYEAKEFEKFTEGLMATIGRIGEEEYSIDLSTVKKATVELNDRIYIRHVNTWYSYETTSSDYVSFYKEYVDEDGEQKLVLIEISQMAFYLNRMMPYEMIDGVLSFLGSYQGYLTINDEASTFKTAYYTPYKAYLYNENGTVDRSKYIYFDGTGDAIYVEAKLNNDGSELSKIEYKFKPVYSGLTLLNDEIYYFENGSKSFYYIEFTRSNVKYFAIEKSSIKEFTRTVDGLVETLKIDGFSNKASLGTENGYTYGTYYMVDETTVKFYYVVNNTSYSRLFDINGNTFTARGNEYGTFQVYDNTFGKNLFFDFDGYGNATIYSYSNLLDKENRINEMTGIYEMVDGHYIVKYDGKEVEGQLSLRTGSDGVSSGAYVVSHKDIVQVYVNQNDWTILTLDEIGNVIKSDAKGNKQRGSYIIVSDSLLYCSFTTDSSLYVYDKVAGTAKEKKVLSRSYTYYTVDFESIRFNNYGYALYHQNTRYYFDKDENGNIIVYRPAKANETANAYGFVEDMSFATLDNVIDYSLDGKRYYLRDNPQIQFVRDQETRKEYPGTMTIPYNGKPTTGDFPIANLSFTPSGSKLFRVKCNFDLLVKTDEKGVDSLYHDSQGGYLVREYDEDGNLVTYVELDGFFRWYVDLRYYGENELDDTQGTYTVTGMKTAEVFEAYRFLQYYYYYYSFNVSYANNYKNEIGTITIFTDYDKTGNKKASYITGKFGRLSYLTDTLGNIIGFDKAEFTKELIDDRYYYTVYTKGSDGITYSLTFVAGLYSPSSTQYVYAVDSFSRVEEVECEDGYTLLVEKVLYSQYQKPIGSIYRYSLMKNGVKVDIDEKIKIGTKTYYVSREKDINGKVISTKYFYFVVIDENADQVNEGEVPYVKSASVICDEVVTYYDETGDKFVDIDSTNQVRHYKTGTIVYKIQSSSYDEATKTYTIKTTNNVTFTIRIVDGKAVIERANQ